MTTTLGKRLDKEIDGDTYSVAYMPVGVAMEFADKLAKLAAPLLEGGALKMPKPDDKVDKQLVLDMVSKLLSKLEAKRLVALVKEIMIYVSVGPDGTGVELKISWEQHFQGKFDTLFRVLRFFMEVQYDSFFKLLPEDALSE